jgi:hypothetical protein
LAEDAATRLIFRSLWQNARRSRSMRRSRIGYDMCCASVPRGGRGLQRARRRYVPPRRAAAAALVPERQLKTAESEADLWLLFAPIKRARLDWLVERRARSVPLHLPVWTARTQWSVSNRAVAGARDRRGRAE